MNHEQAHKILDRAKDGEQFSSFTINQALYLTGDLGIHERDRSAGMDTKIQQEGFRAGNKYSQELVVSNNF